MPKSKPKTPGAAAKLPATISPGKDPRFLAKAATRPSITSALAIDAFDVGLGAQGVDKTVELMDELRTSMDRADGGDLSTIGAMLVGQATALQAMFVSLARRAQRQEYQRHFEGILGLALKCQAQSRATIDSLVNLKYPRTTVIAKQANVNAGGQQQVNNGAARAPEAAIESTKTELLGVSDGQQDQWLDTGATTTPAGRNPQVETLGAVNRPEESRGQGDSRA